MTKKNAAGTSTRPVLTAEPRHAGLRLISNSANETLTLGRLIGRQARPPLVIALSGPVGAGKTTLVKGIAAGMGISPDKVHSPSFVLIREYRGPRHWLFHADCYRLATPRAIVSLGLEEYVSPRGILVVEWPYREIRLLTQEYLDIRIGVRSRSGRLITLRSAGSRASLVVRRLALHRKRRNHVSAEH